jgi:hypothetical protein
LHRSTCTAWIKVRIYHTKQIHPQPTALSPMFSRLVQNARSASTHLCTKDVGAFPVPRERKASEGARERSSLMLIMKRFDIDLNRPLARLLAFAEILAHKRENFLLNVFSGLRSRYLVNLLHTDLKTRPISRDIIHCLVSHIKLPYWAIGWHTEVHNGVHYSCHSRLKNCGYNSLRIIHDTLRYVLEFIFFTSKII